MIRKQSKTLLICVPVAIFLLILSFMLYKETRVKPVRNKVAAVEAMTLKGQSYADTISALGHVEAIEGVLIKANTSGRITKVNVHSGQQVKKGDILLEVNPESIRANLAYNQAQTNLDKVTLERYQRLYKQNAVAKETLDTAKSTYKKDLAQHKIILAELHNAVIRAPFSGSVGIVRPKNGQYVNAGDPLLSLQTLDRVYVNFSLPSQNQAEVKVGQMVKLHLDAYSGKVFEGRVKAIDNMINKKTNAISVRSVFDNPNHQLLPGALGDVDVVTHSYKNQLIVPSQAVNYDSGATYIYVIKNDRAYRQKVTVGSQIDQDEVVVASGLSAGEKIVSVGGNKLSNGESVKVVSIGSY